MFLLGIHQKWAACQESGNPLDSQGHTGLLFQFWWATKCRKWSRAHAIKGLHSEYSCTNGGEVYMHNAWSSWCTLNPLHLFASSGTQQGACRATDLILKAKRNCLGLHCYFFLTTSSFSSAHILIISYQLWACYSKNLFHPPPVSWQHIRRCQNPVLGFIILYKH